MALKREDDTTRLNVDDSRTMWSRVKSMARVGKNFDVTRIKLRVDGEDIIEEKMVAEHLNQYF